MSLLLRYGEGGAVIRETHGVDAGRREKPTGRDGRNEDPRGDFSFSVAVRRMDGTQAVVRGLHQLSSLLFSCGYISCDLTPPHTQEEPRRSALRSLLFKDNQNRIERNAGRTWVRAEPQVADER